MTPTTMDPPKSVQDVVTNMQQPGTAVTVEFEGQSVTLEDPRGVCLELADRIEAGDLEESPETDPWPMGRDDKPVEHLRARMAQEIGEELVRRLARFAHLRAYDLDYVYRNKDRWESKGRTVFGKLQKSTGLLRHYARTDFVVLVNWHAWEMMTPWQKVALVYHELRHADLEGKTQGHDFEGFFDELELFGTGTYEDWNHLASAASAGAAVDVQYHLSFEQ